MRDDAFKPEQLDSAPVAGCPLALKFGEAENCGRPLHLTEQGVDEQPVCLMHSNDPRKSDGVLYQAFVSEFEEILKRADTGEANFSHFIFPRLDVSERKLLCRCLFHNVHFAEQANFRGTIFAQDAEFYDSIFKREANFSRTSFEANGMFVGTTFKDDVDFWGARFMKEAIFVRTRFRYFVKFVWATFESDATFQKAKFPEGATFVNATFNELVDYNNAKFGESVYWNESIFLNRVSFRGTEFVSTRPDDPSANFTFASFAKPDETVFDNLDLSRVVFHNCDISRVWFTSSVRWGKQDGRRAVLFEEACTPKAAYRSGVLQADELVGTGRLLERRDFKAIARVYQQLKKNYDARLDYALADEFHFGEMEMMRLEIGNRSAALAFWQRNFSLVALYRWGSNYGNSYKRPLWWMIAILSVFAFLFPLVGLAHSVGQPPTIWVETFRSALHAGSSGRQKVWYLFAALGHGVLAAIDTATFQRNIEYAPVYPWGRVLAMCEALLTSTLVGLFLLAVRRQFRR